MKSYVVAVDSFIFCCGLGTGCAEVNQEEPWAWAVEPQPSFWSMRFSTSEGREEICSTGTLAASLQILEAFEV